MSPWINYHHLYYFKTIAEEGSVSKAAVRLRLGQPTLSAQLKQFEESLGVQLFLRRHKQLILTEQGLVALDYAKNIFRIGSEMYEVLHDRLKPLKPSLHIGALDSVPKRVILEMTKQALKLAPCQVTLSEGNADELLRELMGHRMDIMLSNFLPVGIQGKGLFPKIISKKKICFYGSAKYRGLAQKFPLSLSGVPMILPSYASRLRQDIDQWAKINNIELNIVVESQDISVKKLMAVNGIGVIPAARHAVESQVVNHELVELGQVKNIFEELYLITANRKIENPIAAKLRDHFNID